MKAIWAMTTLCVTQLYEYTIGQRNSLCMLMITNALCAYDEPLLCRGLRHQSIVLAEHTRIRAHTHTHSHANKHTHTNSYFTA